jgi:hypothetical protein
MDGLNTNENGEYITDEDILGVKYSDIHMYANEPHKLKESNPSAYEAIKEKEIKNAFKLKPMPKYEPKLPSYKRETINYYKNTIQKPEKLRRRNIAPQVQVFKFGKVAVDELALKGHRRKFLGKNANTESRLNEEKQKVFVPKRFPHMAGDPDLLKHSYQNTEPSLPKTTRVS